MYTPEYFRENDKKQIERLIKQNSFATLVSNNDGDLAASHVPLLFDSGRSEKGILIGHMARSNQQWKSLKKPQKVLAIFQGTHSYISPSWYKSPGFPTWNYSVVHVSGILKVINDESALYSIIERLTKEYERKSQRPWVPDLTDEEKSKLPDMIVGFEIEITNIQGKFKLSQNRSIEDQQSVIKNLNTKENSKKSSVAELMEANLAKNSNPSLNPTA